MHMAKTVIRRWPFALPAWYGLLLVDILAWPPSNFRALKNVFAETQQNKIAETTQWTLCLIFDSHFMCSNCSSSAFAHVFSHSLDVGGIGLSYNSLVDRSLWQAVPYLLAIFARWKRLHNRLSLSDDARLTSDIHLSVAYIRPKSRTERARKTLHRGRPRHTWLVHHFQVQKVKGQLAGGGVIL